MSALLPFAALCCSVSAARAGSPDPSSVRIQEKITRYAITADSMDELRAQLRHDVPSAHGGNGAHGRTRSDIRIAYDLARTDRGCRLRNLEVRLAIEVTLPDWPPDRTPQTWQRARSAVGPAAPAGHRATNPPETTEAA